MYMTYKQYIEAMDYVEKIYDEYVKLNPQDLINEQRPFKPNDTFVSIDSGSLMEWDKEDCKLMYLFDDFHTGVYYDYDGSLTVSRAIESTNDEVTLTAYFTDKNGEFKFRVVIDE